MSFPPRLFRSRVSSPDSLILKSGMVDNLDIWSVADRKDILDAMEDYARAYSQDYAIAMLFIVLAVSLVCALINFILGYETDLYDVACACLFLPLITMCSIRLGMEHTVELYRKALEEATNDL